MGFCHIIEQGVAGYINAATWDAKWVTAVNGTTKVFEYTMQSWAAEQTSRIVVRCNSVTVLEPSSRMSTADVAINVYCKLEPIEFSDETKTDGTGAGDKITYSVPFIRDAEHARKIVNFNSEQMAKVLGGDMDTLVDGINGNIETLNPGSTIHPTSEVCEGWECPAFKVLTAAVDGSEESVAGAVTMNSIRLQLKGYVDGYVATTAYARTC